MGATGFRVGETMSDACGFRIVDFGLWIAHASIRNPQSPIRNGIRGVTLAEVLVSAVVVAVLAGGTLLAFVSAVRISQRVPSTVEATSYAQQTLERYRNLIACDSAWFNPATCLPAGLPVNKVDVLQHTHRFAPHRCTELEPGSSRSHRRIATA